MILTNSKKIVKLSFKNLIINNMKNLILLLALVFLSCQNPVNDDKPQGASEKQKMHYYKLQLVTYESIIDCDSIEYDFNQDVLIIHTTPCGEVIPEFSKFINSNNFKIIPK